MAPCVGVRGGPRYAPDGVGMVHSWANRGKDGGEIVKGPCEHCTRVSDGNGDKFHPPHVLLEGCDEGGVVLGLLRVFLVASEISGEPDRYDSMRMRVHNFCRSWSGRGRSCPRLLWLI